MTALQVASRAARAHPDPGRHRHHHAARAARQRRAARLMDPERIERDDPRWATDLARRHDPIQGEGAWRRLLPGDRDDVADSAAADAARDPRASTRRRSSWCGDRDPFVPVDHAWGLPARLGDGAAAGPPGCGHDVAAGRPGILNEALAGFYRATEAVAAPARRSALEETADDHAPRALPPARRRRRGPRASSSAGTRRSTCRSWRQTPGLRGTSGPACHRGASAARPTSSSSPPWTSTTAPRWTRPRLGRDARRRPEPARDRARPGDAAGPRGRSRTGRAPLPPSVDTVDATPEERRDRTARPSTTPPTTPATTPPVDVVPRRLRVEPPGQVATASRWSRSCRPEALNALSFDARSTSSPTRSRRSTADPTCRAIVLTGDGDARLRGRRRHPRARRPDPDRA